MPRTPMGPAPWDLGEPQPAVVRLASAGAFTGAVLDAGCGTGDNALHIASLGLDVVGFDVAATAVSIARAKAAERGADAEFLVADALRLHGLGREFDTVLDCALLHTFDRDERRRYLASLASVVRRGGRLHVLCFSDVGPGPRGPHPLGEDDLRAAFEADGGWSVSALAADRLCARFAMEGVPAWLASVDRI